MSLNRSVVSLLAACCFVVIAQRGYGDIVVISDSRSISASADGCLPNDPDPPNCSDELTAESAIPLMPFGSEVTANAPFASSRALQISFFEADRIVVYGELETETSPNPCNPASWGIAGASSLFTATFTVTEPTPFTLVAGLGTIGAPHSALTLSLVGPGVNEETVTQDETVVPVRLGGQLEPGVYTLTVNAVHELGAVAGAEAEFTCVLGLWSEEDPGPPLAVVPSTQARQVWWEETWCSEGCETDSDSAGASDFGPFNATAGGAMQLSIINELLFAAVGRVSATASSSENLFHEQQGLSTYTVQFIVPSPVKSRAQLLSGGGASISLTRHTSPQWTIEVGEEPFDAFYGIVAMPPGVYTIEAEAQAFASANDCVETDWDDDVFFVGLEFFEDVGPDLNGDGAVNGADLGLLLAAWGPCPGCPEDLNGDGVVDGMDLGLLLAEWG